MMLLLLLTCFRMPWDVNVTGNGETNANSPTETEGYKKQNGLDYPVNVARWDNLLVPKASEASDGDFLFLQEL